MKLTLQLGWDDARSSLGRTPSLAALLAGLVVIAAAALVSWPPAPRTLAASASLPRVVALGVVLPLICFGLAGRAGSNRAALLACEWARHGANRRTYALGRLALALVAGLGASLLVALGALGVEHAAQALGGGALVASRPTLFVLAAALVSLAYVALFIACELLANGWGRSSLLVMDWLLGSGMGAVALLWPRAHARTLLGGSPVAQLSITGSALALVLLAIAASALYARRVPP